MNNLRHFKHLVIMLGIIPLFQSCQMIEDIEMRAAELNRFQISAYNLAKENHQLKNEIGNLQHKIKKLESEKNFLTIKVRKMGGRMPAAIAAPKNIIADKNDDLVNFSTFQWSEKDLLKIARTEFSNKNFKKSAQYFYTFINAYPKSEYLDDSVIFQSGMAAFESNQYYKWSLDFHSQLVREYPNSKFFRNSKLWTALNHLKMGHNKKFYNVVEEFRLKYRNTPEWKLLSAHYEEFTNLYKE